MANVKKRFVKDLRPAKGDLDVNDALRLAVEDKRFAQALITQPDKFVSVFNIKDVEITAIKDALNIPDIAEGFEYE
jgi:hypothetical protein